MTSSFDWDTFYATALVTAGIDGADPSLALTEPGPDQRWSTWPETAHTLDRGPQPHPDWVVQHAGALDTELGVLKTGKEADAFLIERALPETERSGAPGEATLMVAKRYRSAQHSSFHRSAAYTEGRRVKDSREARAIAQRSTFGRDAAAGQWARAEFDTLSRLHAAGLPVPYPVQILGTEVCMEFVGDAERRTAAPRLHERRPARALADCWARELREVVLSLADLGIVHGDLSPYNVLVDARDRLVVIDVPQVIDLIGNPHGAALLRRDCENVCSWLRSHGAEERLTDPEDWARAADPR